MRQKIYKTIRMASIALVACLVSFNGVAQTIVPITDEAGLRAIATQLDGSYRLQNDITLTGEWEPVGDNDNPFTGTFDGNGHVIKNLVISKDGYDRIGFFGVTNHATITKVGFENVKVTVKNGGGADIGVIIGKSKSTTITESYVSGGYLEGRDHVGAIAGGCGKDGDSEPVTLIQDCYATLTILTREWQVGGIAGTLDYTKINRCYFSGTTENLNLGGGAVSSIAGLVDGGSSEQNVISNCVALSPAIRGGNVPGRILGNWDTEYATKINNYALTTMKIFPDPNGDHAADTHQGADVDKATAKTADFYTNTLHWDLTNTWTLYPEEGGNGGIYPVLKWQTNKVYASILGVSTEPILIVFGNDFRTEFYGSHGQKVSYSSSDEDILFAVEEGESAVFLTGDAGMRSGNALAIGSSVETSYLTEGRAEVPVTVRSIAEMTVEVRTPAEFNAIRDELQLYYVLKADIDLSGYNEFEPIGTKDHPFKGRLTGNGHKITGLTITGTSDRVGLFGYADGAAFIDFTLEAPAVSGNQDVGGLLGKCVGTRIERVAVTSANIYGVDHVGAIAGGTDSGATTTITNSYATSQATGLTVTNHQMGGLLGVAKSTVIEKSYFSGALVNSNNTTSANVGGFIGLIEDENVKIRNAVSLAFTITAPEGCANAFVARGDHDLAEASNIYYLKSMSVVTNPEIDNPGFPAPSEDLGKEFTDLITSEFYVNVLGWDFTNIWEFETGPQAELFPVLKHDNTAIQPVNEIKGLNVSSLGGYVSVKLQSPADVYIYDITGRPVQIYKNVSEVSVPLAKGIYIVKTVGASSAVAKVLNK